MADDAEGGAVHAGEGESDFDDSRGKRDCGWGEGEGEVRGWGGELEFWGRFEVEILRAAECALRDVVPVIGDWQEVRFHSSANIPPSARSGQSNAPRSEWPALIA